MPPIQDPNKLKEIAAQQAQQGQTLAGPGRPAPWPGATPEPLVNPYRETTARQADERISLDREAGSRAEESLRLSQDANAREAERLNREKRADEIRGGPPSTEEERKAASRAIIMTGTWDLIQEAQKKNPGALLPTMREVLGSATGNQWIRDASIPESVRSARIQLNGLYRDFIQTAIYQASGAAFQEAELKAAIESLQPNYWDDPESMAMKKRQIELKIAAAMTSAGAAKETVTAAIEQFNQEAGKAFKPMVRGDAEEVEEEKELSTDKNDKVAKTLPPEAQKAFTNFMKSQVPGKLKVGEFVSFYTNLAKKHGFSENIDLPYAQEYVKTFNRGEPISTTIPVSQRDKNAWENLVSDAAASPTGTAVKEYASAMTLGLPELLAGEEGQTASRLANEANPKSAVAGAVVGSIAPALTLEKATAKILSRLGIKEGTRAYRLGSDLIANMLQGGVTESNKAGGDMGELAEGAAWGAGGTMVGRTVAKGAKEFKSKEVRDSIEALGEQPIFNDAGEQIGKVPAVDMTTPQRMGGTRAEEFVEGFPGVAGARQGAVDSWNTREGARVLARVGRTLPKGTRPGQETNKKVKEILDEEYMKIAPLIKGKVDANFLHQFDAIKLTALGPKPATADPAVKEMWGHLEDATKKFIKGKKFDYKSYKEYVQQVREWQTYWASSKMGTDELPSPIQNEMGRRAALLVKAARQLVARNSPDAAEKLGKIDEAWRHQMVNDLASLGPAKQNRGAFAPAEKLNAVERLDTSKRKTATSRGEAFEQAPTQDAMDVLGKKPSRGGSVIGTGALGYTVGGTLLSPALLATYAPFIKRITQALTDGRIMANADGKLPADFIAKHPWAKELPSDLVKQIMASYVREEGTGE